MQGHPRTQSQSATVHDLFTIVHSMQHALPSGHTQLVLQHLIITIQIIQHALPSGHAHLFLAHLIITIPHNNSQSKKAIESIIHIIFYMQFYTYKILSHLKIAPTLLENKFLTLIFTNFQHRLWTNVETTIVKSINFNIDYENRC